MEGSRKMVLWIAVMFLLPAQILLIAPEEIKGEEANWEYHSSYEAVDLLISLSDEHPDVASYHTASDMVGTRGIPGNREIPILIIGDENDLDRPWVMFMGGHHGDEPDSVEAVLGFCQYLLDGWEVQEQDISRLINGINMVILPVVNPYGLDNGIRFDENGEDPNRDYPFSPEGITYYSDGIPLTTAGAYTVHELSKRYPFTLSLSFHTGSKGIYTPWGADQVEEITPDGNMFTDLGSVLSRASGQDLYHGPANNNGYLGDLKGAFDDHLYGSTFYNELLDSNDNMLPWSIATATVEMIVSKGREPQNLGSLQGVEDIGGGSDGTVPMGVRMCLAASELALPSLEGQWIDEGGQTFEIRGCGSAPVISGSMYQNGTIIEPMISLEQVHPYLPVYHYNLEWIGSDGSFDREITVESMIDVEWNQMAEGSDPEINPVSLLSLSRKGSDSRLVWSGSLKGDGMPPEIERGEIIIDSIYPEIQEAGRPCTVSLTIPEDVQDIHGLTIEAYVGSTGEATYIMGDDVAAGNGEYEFTTPIIEGQAKVEVTLRSANWTYKTQGSLELYPRVYISTMLREPNLPEGQNDVFRLIIGIDGGTSDTNFFYGVSRDPDEPWSGDGWILRPMGVVSYEYGPHTIELDLNDLGGSAYLRVCHHPGAVEDVRELDLGYSIRISEFPLDHNGNEIIIGPGLIIIDHDGLQELNQRESGLSIGYDILDEEGDKLGTYQMTWLDLYSFNRTGREIILASAMELGMDPVDVTGGWYASRALPIFEDRISIRYNITGRLVMGPSVEPIMVNITTIMGDLTLDEDHKEEHGDDFPYWLIIFFISMAALVLLISYVRKDAHISRDEKNEKLPDKKEHPRRTGAERKGMRRAPPPPWGSLK